MLAWLKARRRRRLLALSALLLVVLAPYAVSRLRSGGRRVRVISPPAARTAGHVPTLRVLAYNIAHGRGTAESNWSGTADEKQRRLKAIAKLLADVDADVVVLNEVDFDCTWSGGLNQAEAIARSAGYAHRAEQRNFDVRLPGVSWKFGNAILSRYPIESAQLVPFPVLSGWEETLAGSKQGLVCRLRLSAAQRVRLLAVHLEPRSERVRAAAANVIVCRAATSDIPLIAAGDFNASPGASPAPADSSTNRDVFDVLDRSACFRRPASTGGTPRSTFPATRPTRAIDWVLAPPGWRFAACDVLPARLSDHRPVIATLQASPVKTNSQ